MSLSLVRDRMATATVLAPKFPCPPFRFQIGDKVRVREDGNMVPYWPLDEASIARVVNAREQGGWPFYELHCEDGVSRWFPQIRLLSA